MNRHFTKNHDIITVTTTQTPSNSKNRWMGIIPHTDMDVAEIAIEGVNGGVKLTVATTPTAANYVKDLPTGIPFLAYITEIKLTSGGCKMINPE